MKQFLVFVMFFSISFLGAISLEQYSTTGSVLTARIESLRLSPMLTQPADISEGDTSAPTSAVIKTFAFPYQQAQIQINSMIW
ncbi:MAG: hypothetical protein PHO32_08620, partial [Candidatus Cloacimonetes bacterium]|nr:hypothetical protein [Candidatus Cloacimonadota bacterium]